MEVAALRVAALVSTRSGNRQFALLGQGERLSSGALQTGLCRPTVALLGAGAALSDNILIQAAQRGDLLALAAILERHQAAICGYLRSRLPEGVEAEELAQEVFVRSIARARPDNATLVRPWLMDIAHDLLREHVRRLKRPKAAAWTKLCLELEALLPRAAERSEESPGQLPECLESLGQSARQALDLRYRTRLRVSQIAEKMHRSEAAVAALLARSRQALRQCLDGKAPGRTDD
jgi:RNA polymerase sigma-70 factor (ECF subfamily)